MTTAPDKPNSAQIGWNHLGTKRIYKSQWFNLRSDHIKIPSGREIYFTYGEHPGAVFVIPVTPDKKIILMKQYRYTIDQWCWEIVAGGLGDRKGMTKKEVVRAELKEEIGATAEKIEFLNYFYSANGMTDLKANYYIAHNTILSHKPEPEDTEEIKDIQEFEIEELLRMIDDGQIKDAETVIAITQVIKKIKK